MKTLVVYFSQTGNTKAAAEKIAEIANADKTEIKTRKLYDLTYWQTVFTSLKEIFTKERPELNMELPDISSYDRILIGAPIWCETIPNAIFTFLDQVDLSSKKAALFTTSGASDPMKIAVKLKKKYAAKWCRPFNCNHASEDDIMNWLK